MSDETTTETTEPAFEEQPIPAEQSAAASELDRLAGEIAEIAHANWHPRALSTAEAFAAAAVLMLVLEARRVAVALEAIKTPAQPA